MSCIIDGCDKKAEKRGWCAMHYRRWRVHGDVNANLRPNLGSTKAFMHDVVLSYDGGECLIWPFARNNQGYATFNGRLATRFVCTKANGAPPSPKHEAAHTCGAGSSGCVAKRHLVWKTRTENEMDKILHGTTNRGERSGNAKLTNAQVRELHQLLGVMSDRKIALIYGVSYTTIREIRIGKRWAWMQGEAA